MNNGVNQITLSVKEFQLLGKDVEKNFPFHEDNMKNWISAALTNVDMCIDGILGDMIRETQIHSYKFQCLRLFDFVKLQRCLDRLLRSEGI
ncbi:hypothetical protein L1887_10074 [Cichorium endivia]|nr:hypothetical protein L1887_10074 [Cichorium endivia]